MINNPQFTVNYVGHFTINLPNFHGKFWSCLPLCMSWIALNWMLSMNEHFTKPPCFASTKHKYSLKQMFCCASTAAQIHTSNTQLSEHPLIARLWIGGYWSSWRGRWFNSCSVTTTWWLFIQAAIVPPLELFCRTMLYGHMQPAGLPD